MFSRHPQAHFINNRSMEVGTSWCEKQLICTILKFLFVI